MPYAGTWQTAGVVSAAAALHSPLRCVSAWPAQILSESVEPHDNIYINLSIILYKNGDGGVGGAFLLEENVFVVTL